MIHPLPTVTQAYNMLKQEEKQRKVYVSSLSSNSVALSSVSGNFSTKTSQYGQGANNRSVTNDSQIYRPTKEVHIVTSLAM